MNEKCFTWCHPTRKCTDIKITNEFLLKGFTHMLMDGVSVCMHRNLSDRHPIYKLLLPHFHYMHAINRFCIFSLFLLRFYSIFKIVLNNISNANSEKVAINCKTYPNSEEVYTNQFTNCFAI